MPYSECKKDQIDINALIPKGKRVYKQDVGPGGVGLNVMGSGTAFSMH